MDKATFKAEIYTELQNILQFWLNYSFDDSYGGFIGKMDNEGKNFHHAEKGSVLNARILWTFSAAYNQNDDSKILDRLQAATRAFQYINQHFRDKIYGGVYWSVDAKGNPLNTRKQIYALAFTIYGLSEYYKATQVQEALDFAIELFELIELHSYDKITDGYNEAFTQSWEIIEDLRLSEKDRNDPKTMNTHLHIIEAYVNLYSVWKNSFLAEKIRCLLDIFEYKIINHENFHLGLFFDNEWKKQSDAISYGHDIEASWLLLEAAEILKDDDLIMKWKKIALNIVNAASEGLNEDGSLIHEFNPTNQHFDSHREWWVSAEGMVGFLNAYQLANDRKQLEKVFQLWSFIKKYLRDTQQGEWFWGVNSDYSIMNEEDKIGFWKCPYHNVRACLEILKRL
ncbi:AGE family epimerase/isomerase [Emticicia sp. SJ17W-69]|uniref:AGE family epimerase/isomerase n=1 Tax=Emticicia sp. SJ17W-69 TaxID=3421657 RepID=UPI003EB6CE71